MSIIFDNFLKKNYNTDFYATNDFPVYYIYYVFYKTIKMKLTFF